MRLQTKISLAILPLVALTIFFVGARAVITATKVIQSTMYQVIEAELKYYVLNTVSNLNNTLNKHGLSNVDSFVEEYQQNAIKAAAKVRYFSTGYLLIIGESGKLLFFSQKDQPDIKNYWPKIVNDIISQENKFIRGQHSLNNQGEIFIGHHFSPWKWTIIYAISSKELSAPSRTIRDMTVIAAVLCTALSFLIIFFLIKKFVIHPVSVMKEAAVNIAERRQIEKIPVETTDELGILSRSMENMAHAIQKYQKEQEDWHSQLEQKIKERTIELQNELNERKLVEEKLRESEKKSRLWLEHSPICTKIVDLDFNLQYMSESGIRELKIDDITKHYGKPYPFYFYPDSFKIPMTENLKKARNTGEIITQEASVVDIEGNELWYHSTIVPVNDDEGKLDYIMVVSMETTDRKQAEEALREANTRHSAMIANIGDVIGIMGTDGIMKYKSPNIEKWFGWKPEELIGTDAWETVYPEDIERIQKEFYALLEKDNTSTTLEYRYKCKDGTYTWIELTATNRINNTTINGILLNYHDISERKRAEEKLRQAQKMEAIGTLAGGIAHDFNNILSPILGFTEMLQEDLTQDSPEQKNVTEVLHAALRAKDLVKQILTFSHQHDLELKPIKIQSVLKEALKLLGSSIPTTIEIQTEIDPNCGVVIADPTQIHQIIMNLATNAYHAMRESGGRLKIILNQTEIESNPLGYSDFIPGRYALLKVIDTGTGIKKDILDKIFDPYFTTKESDKGTGLGLSVVQGIVKRFNGDIHVYSESGKGTEFHVYLPIIINAPENGKLDLSKPIQGGTERILLVDDEEPIVKMEKLMLGRLGYHVTTRIGSFDALDTFKANPDDFDLIITDMTMPKMTGTQLASEIKAIRTDIPIIICTGFSDRINEKTSSEFDIQAFITKPVIKREIAQIVRNVLDKPDD